MPAKYDWAARQMVCPYCREQFASVAPIEAFQLQCPSCSKMIQVWDELEIGGAMSVNELKRVETESERKELAPCPFCGHQNVVLITCEMDGMPELEEDYFVRCKNCFAQGPNRMSEARAIREWNREYEEQTAVFGADALDLAKRITVEMKIKRLGQWRWRLRLALPILQLGAWIGGLGDAKIGEVKPWRYYCPHCRGVFEDVEPDKPGVLVVGCPDCGYQSLVGGSEGQWYTINPDCLQDDVELCSYGCHYAEPYGFVPMADCPIHG